MRHVHCIMSDADGGPAAPPATAVDTAALLDRLRAARGRGPAALALDGDGTLWQPDVGHRLVERTLAARRVLPAALLPLQSLARRHDLALADDPNDQLALIVAAYLAGDIPPAEAYRVGGIMFAGHDPAGARAWGERVVADLGPTFHIAPAWTLVLDWARAAAVDVWLVSAGAWPGALAAARRAGIDPSRVIACTFDDPRTEPLEHQPPIPHGAGKPRLLRARTDARLLAAFGDDAHDAPLLAAAELPVALAGTAAARLRLPGLLCWHPEPTRHP